MKERLYMVKSVEKNNPENVVYDKVETPPTQRDAIVAFVQGTVADQLELTPTEIETTIYLEILDSTKPK